MVSDALAPDESGLCLEVSGFLGDFHKCVVEIDQFRNFKV